MIEKCFEYSIVQYLQVFGIAGIALLVSGIYRVIKFGQGSEFYTENPIFWTKIIVFALVGSLSLYPTITYILWAIPLSKGSLPQVTENLVSRLRLIINIELVGFSSGFLFWPHFINNSFYFC